MNTYRVIDVMLSIPLVYEHPEGFDAVPKGICRHCVTQFEYNELRFASGWGAKDKNENPLWRGRIICDGDTAPTDDDLTRIKQYLRYSMQKHGYVVCDCSVTTKAIDADTYDQVPGLNDVG